MTPLATPKAQGQDIKVTSPLWGTLEKFLPDVPSCGFRKCQKLQRSFPVTELLLSPCVTLLEQCDISETLPHLLQELNHTTSSVPSQPAFCPCVSLIIQLQKKKQSGTSVTKVNRQDSSIIYIYNIIQIYIYIKYKYKYKKYQINQYKGEYSLH